MNKSRYSLKSYLSRRRESKKPSVTEPFSVILKKMKAGKKAKLKIKTDQQLEDLEKEEQKDPKMHLVKLENQKQLIKLYESNHTTVFDDLKKDFGSENKGKEIKTEINIKKMKEKFSFSQPKNKKAKYGFEQFNKTSYVNQSSMKEFYNKYSQYNTLMRKHTIKSYTPSWAFIKSTKDQKIIPNPLGLIKRSGDERILGINNQKVGDNYMQALTNSLKYSEHLISLEFGGK